MFWLQIWSCFYRDQCVLSPTNLLFHFLLCYLSFKLCLDLEFEERFMDEKGNLFTFAFPFLVSLSKSKDPNTALAVPSKNLLLLLKLALGKVIWNRFHFRSGWEVHSKHEQAGFDFAINVLLRKFYSHFHFISTFLTT